MRFALRANFAGHAGHAVIEAGADRDEEVAIIDGVVGEGGAVHAEHAHGQRLRRIDGADAHQRRHDRNAERVRELGERASGVGVDHAAAGIDQRTARLAEHLEEPRRPPRGSTHRSASSFIRRR